MERLATPWCFLGPSGSGKASQARRWIEEAHGTKLPYPLELRTFSVGDDYEAKVLASPYHFEIDIPNLSMQDKQIIGDLLTMFLSTGDVLNSLHSSTRKLVILRRAHCLSLPAAIRVRAILQQYVFPANASGMLWITAREMTGALSLLEDGFVRVSVPRMPVATWCATESIPAAYRTPVAWEKLDGRPERAQLMATLLPDATVWPRRIQDFYDEVVAEMMRNRTMTEPNLDVVQWIRGRVYDALSFCQTGPEIVDSCAAALARYYDGRSDPPAVFWEAMECLAQSEPHTSYRTPLALEWAMLNLFDVMRRKTEEEVSIHGAGKGMVALSDNKAKRPAAPKATAAATKTPTAARSRPSGKGARESLG